MLDKRREEMHSGANPSVTKKLTYGRIRKDLIDYYITHKKKSLQIASRDIKDDKENVILKKGEQYIWGLPNLDTFFADFKVQDITPGILVAYSKKRQSAGADGGTVKREFNILRRAMNIAREHGSLQIIPHFPMPSENAPRQGFIEPYQFTKIRETLPEKLHPLVTFLYECGCRIGAAKQITWSQVNLKTKELSLPWTQTKNGSLLVLPLSTELLTVLKKQFHKESDLVFDATNLRRNGKRLCWPLSSRTCSSTIYAGRRCQI